MSTPDLPDMEADAQDNIAQLEANAPYNPDRTTAGEETVEGIGEALARLST